MTTRFIGKQLLNEIEKLAQRSNPGRQANAYDGRVVEFDIKAAVG